MSRRSAAAAHVIAAARGWLGTPYHDQASVRGVGTDCLGLARGVWREVVGPEPDKVPPYSRDWGLVAGPRGIDRSSGAIEGGQGPAGQTGPREASETFPQGTNRSSGAIGGGEGPTGLAEGAVAWMVPLPTDRLCPGALLLFRMREGAVAKHCGILTEISTIIHAYDRLGVIEEPFSPAWRRRLAFACLYPQARDVRRG